MFTLHNKLNQKRWAHHIYRNKRGRVHTSFSHLNKSIIYRHYCLSLARPNDVYNKIVHMHWTKLESASIQLKREDNMGSKLNKQSCIWEPLNIFNFVFYSLPPKERKENKSIYTGKLPTSKKKNEKSFWVFILNSTTSMEIKLTIFFGFS